MSRRPMTGEPAATEPPHLAPKLTLHYRRRSGRRRTVLVAVDQTDVWFVYDVPAGTARASTGLLVDRLGGYDDRLDAALALAQDYLATQTAFRAGRRDDFTCPDPLPRARRRPLAVIRRDAARARTVVAKHSEPDAAIAA